LNLGLFCLLLLLLLLSCSLVCKTHKLSPKLVLVVGELLGLLVLSSFLDLLISSFFSLLPAFLLEHLVHLLLFFAIVLLVKLEDIDGVKGEVHELLRVKLLGLVLGSLLLFSVPLLTFVDHLLNVYVVFQDSSFLLHDLQSSVQKNALLLLFAK